MRKMEGIKEFSHFEQQIHSEAFEQIMAQPILQTAIVSKQPRALFPFNFFSFFNIDMLFFFRFFLRRLNLTFVFIYQGYATSKRRLPVFILYNVQYLLIGDTLDFTNYPPHHHIYLLIHVFSFEIFCKIRMSYSQRLCIDCLL